MRNSILIRGNCSVFHRSLCCLAASLIRSLIGVRLFHSVSSLLEFLLGMAVKCFFFAEISTFFFSILVDTVSYIDVKHQCNLHFWGKPTWWWWCILLTVVSLNLLKYLDFLQLFMSGIGYLSVFLIMCI